MVDSEPLWYRVEHDFAAARGGAWTPALAHACIGRGAAYTLHTMSATFGFAVDVARDTAAIMSDFIARAGDLTLKPGCIELLDAARGALPIAVASSSPLHLIRRVLDRFELLPRFGAVVSGESVPNAKPAPDIFLRTARELGAAPAACAVLEDSVAGATAGRAAGMFVIAVPEGSPDGRGFDAVADRVVPDLFAARDCLILPERGAR